MVDGRMIKPSVTVVDLDGTLVRGNTLEMYLRTGVAELIRNGRIDKALAVVALVSARKARIISHEAMKYRAFTLLPRTEKIRLKMAETVNDSLNPHVVSFLDQRRAAGDTILLATAAPEFYVRWFWDGNLVASPEHGPDCKGTAKRDAVNSWLSDHGGKIAYFLTDHRDDLPLAKIAGNTILIDPDKKTLGTFDKNGIRYTVGTPTS